MQDNKTCVTCGVDKSLDDFHRQRANKSDGRRAHCKECLNAERRRHYEEHKEREIARAIKYQKEHPEVKKKSDKKYAMKVAGTEKSRAQKVASTRRFRSTDRYWEAHLQKRYGVTLEEYEAIYERQGGICAICGKSEGEKRLALDHCHETSAIRGLLCWNCNSGLGLLKLDNNPSRLTSVISYLVRHYTQDVQSAS